MSEFVVDREMESEANYFAMCLLMPEQFLRADFPKYRDEGRGLENVIEALANRYKVSVVHMTIRLAQLKLIGDMP
jgi:Zn-dependent peptidase ImmA (M78 family)